MKAGLKPAEIAAQCNVTSNSIRNWSKEFRSHLSEGANAPERYYTDRDATVLRYISTLKQEGMKAHEIAERLAEMTFGETETIEATKMQLELPVPATAQEAQGLTPAVLMVVNDLERRFDAKFASLEQSKRDPIYYMAVGAILALVFVVFLLLLFLVRHYL
jgi:DNA-binding transcriptional MerR regulator